MGVKLRERILNDGRSSFSIDVYHRDYGRFQINTGLTAPARKKDRRHYEAILQQAKDKVRELEKDFVKDPSALFTRRTISCKDFVAYFKETCESKTSTSWKSALKHLEDFTRGVVTFDRINTAWLERFKDYLLSLETVGKNTAGGYLASIKTALKKAYREGYLQEDVTGRVSKIKKMDIERHFLTQQELELLNNTPCQNQMVKSAFLFSCFTGLRLSDIENLKWEQIELANGTLFLRFRQKKTGRYERLPLSEQAIQLLQQVKDIRPEYISKDVDKVFALPGRSRISILLHLWGATAGIAWQLHFHASRHTFATLVLTFGGDLYTTSKLLGHSEISTTQIYGQIVDKKKIDTVQSLPLLNALPEHKAAPTIIQQDCESGKSILLKSLEAEGVRVARALRLPQNATGRYEFNGNEYTASELAIEVSGGK
jgi:integrase